MGRQPLRSKRYGNTTVGGRAKVLLGDSRHTKNYHVGAVNLTIPEELLQLLQDASSHMIVEGQRARCDKKSARQIAACKRSTEIDSSKNDEVGHGQPDPEHVLGFVQKLLYKVWRLPFANPLSNSLSQEDALTIGRSTEPDQHGGQSLVKAYSERAVVVHDHSIVGAFLLSWIIGKNVSIEDVVKFLVNCRQDDLMPLLLLTFCIGVYRYYTMRLMCRAPTQQFWILEDAYGLLRQISMDVLIDYSVFQRFLKVHYRDTGRKTGAALVEANQFHLMLGSRRGIVIGSINWNAAVNDIKPGRHVINSVYTTAYDKTCFSCNSNLIVTEFGEFHCTACNTFHRDYATFNLQARQNTRREPAASPSTEPNPACAARSVQETQEYGPKPVQGVIEGKYDDIKNLDIRLVPRPEASTLWNQGSMSPTSLQIKLPGAVQGEQVVDFATNISTSAMAYQVYRPGISFFIDFYKLDPSQNNQCIFYTQRGTRCRWPCSENWQAIKLRKTITLQPRVRLLVSVYSKSIS